MPRAAPLSAKDRRAAIIAATERLIVAEGSQVSTRAIAQAAGVAEGTIFRVFPTKDAIIDAIFDDAFDQDAFTAQLAKIDQDAALESRMAAVVAILVKRNRRIMALFTALGFRRPPGLGDRQHKAGRVAYFERIAAILEPDRELLRMSPLEAARLLQAMVVAITMPMLADRPNYAPKDIVDLMLNGIAKPESPSC
jgi:AcrR family transcriptional regulator